MKETKDNKTNAVRILETLGIAHEVTAYPSDGTAVDAQTVAALLGVDENCVFKTLVTQGKSGAHYVFVLPAPGTLDLKKAARAAGEKSVSMIAVKDIFGLTGYVRGGCSPVGMKKPFPAFFDETAQLFDSIFVSAGRIGMQVKIAPDDLVRAVGGKYEDLTEG